MSRRPSETVGVAGAVAILIARAAGITDADTIVAMGVCVGFLPTAVTWIVTLIRDHRANGTPPAAP